MPVLLRFIFESVRRSVGASIATGLLLAMGVNVQEFARLIWDQPPVYLTHWASPWAFVVLAVIGFAWIFYRQVAWLNEAGPQPNWSISTAWFYLLLDSKWAINRDTDPKKTSYTHEEWVRDLYATSTQQLKDAASLGQLRIWGRSRRQMGVGTIQAISFDDWNSVGISPSTIHDAPEASYVHDYSTETAFEDIMVNVEQFKKLWPKKNLIDRLRDKTLKKRKEFLFG